VQRRPSWAVYFIPTVVLGLLMVQPLVVYYTDWLWFKAEGFDDIFTIELGGRLLLGALGFLVAFALLAGNYFLAARPLRGQIPLPGLGRSSDPFRPQRGPYGLSIDVGTDEPPSMGKSQLNRLIWLLSLMAAGVAGLYSSVYWLHWKVFGAAEPFGILDPILGWDVGF